MNMGVKFEGFTKPFHFLYGQILPCVNFLGLFSWTPIKVEYKLYYQAKLFMVKVTPD